MKSSRTVAGNTSYTYSSRFSIAVVVNTGVVFPKMAEKLEKSWYFQWEIHLISWFISIAMLLFRSLFNG